MSATADNETFHLVSVSSRLPCLGVRLGVAPLREMNTVLEGRYQAVTPPLPAEVCRHLHNHGNTTVLVLRSIDESIPRRILPSGLHYCDVTPVRGGVHK